MRGYISPLGLEGKFLCMADVLQTASQRPGPALLAGPSLFRTGATICADAKEQCKSGMKEGGLLLPEPLTAPRWQV